MRNIMQERGAIMRMRGSESGKEGAARLMMVVGSRLWIRGGALRKRFVGRRAGLTQDGITTPYRSDGICTCAGVVSVLSSLARLAR